MIRYPSFIIVFLIILVAISLYQVKHFVSQKELELSKINKKIITAQSDLSILKAELSYLKRPSRIEKIAINKLQLKEISAIDIWNLQHLVDVSKSMDESNAK
jgi:cell division protein FtsL